MKKIALNTIALLLLIATTAIGGVKPEKPTSMPNAKKPWLVGDIKMGYYQGFGIHVSATALDFASGFPFSVRLGLGFSRVKAGDEWAARRVWINDNENGTARSNARVWDARFDLLYPVKLLNLERTLLFGGVRRSDFDAFFEYIGGAETFDVKSKHWGLGGGIETAFPIGPRVDMVFTVGGDYYFRGTLSGHDTYYRSDGNNTNPIDNYTYTEADAAVNQPDVMTRLMMGVAYHF